jgi:hypothetical protein
MTPSGIPSPYGFVPKKPLTWPFIVSPHSLASVSRENHRNKASHEERLKNASETPRGIVNDHVRDYFISNTYGEAIPHGAMPGKNYSRHY